MKIGSKIPSLTLLDQNHVSHRLEDMHNKMKLVYFYPKDATPGCTTQACQIRDNFHLLEKHELDVVGISRDSIASHNQFAEKYHLPFRLLSDSDLKAHQEFNALTSDNKTIRSSFLFDKNGVLIHSWPKVNVQEHVLEILQVLKRL